jgi:hypothetical protein
MKMAIDAFINNHFQINCHLTRPVLNGISKIEKQVIAAK